LPETKVELMQISTIHALCADLLRRYAQTAMPRGFLILDATGQFLLVYSNRKLLGLGEIVKGHPKDFYDSVLRTYTLRASGFPEMEYPHLVNER
jgi:superfamily I DNA/RNA helicase